MRSAGPFLSCVHVDSITSRKEFRFKVYYTTHAERNMPDWIRRRPSLHTRVANNALYYLGTSSPGLSNAFRSSLDLYVDLISSVALFIELLSPITSWFSFSFSFPFRSWHSRALLEHFCFLSPHAHTMVSVSAEYLAEDSGGTLVGISITFAVLTTLFLGLRLFSKRFTAVGYGADDVFLVAAYFFNLLMCAVGIG